MIREDKNLVLKDLCARLPYGVQCEIGGLQYGPYTFIGNDVEDLIGGRTFKPYLRPMSSMTHDEDVEYRDIMESGHYHSPSQEYASIIDWLNEHHFDYRGLIEKGLALEAPEGMYSTQY